MSSLKTVFMFSGQGSHYFQMGRQLFDVDETFRQWMMQLDGVAQDLCGRSVIDAIYSAGKAEVFDRTLLTHPAIFMVEYALAQCLIRRGLTPDMTLGASLGSFAAAAIAGHVTVEDAMAAVILQAKAFEGSCDRGGMVAVLADPTLFAEGFLSERSELAAVNFNSHFAVAAAQAQLDPIENDLRRRGVSFQRLAVSFAFHSRLIDPAQTRFLKATQSFPRRPGRLPLVCCAQATLLHELPDDFFWRVVRQPIQFRDTVAQLERREAHRYIDVGPSGTMATFAKYGLAASSASIAHVTLTPFGQDQKNLAALFAPTAGAG